MAEEDGEEPAALRNRPFLEDRLLWVLDAFWLLSRSRQIGLGPGGILLSEVESYCRLAHVADPPLLVRQIHVLDTAWLQWYEKEHASKKSK